MTVALASARSLTARAGQAPEWVHLLDVGRNDARDGRSFVLDDPDAVVSVFERGRVDLPVDYHHQHDAPPKGHTGPIPAAGWITAIRREGDRILGRVRWTAQAAELLAAKGFRYISPALRHDGRGRILAIAGAGLVHNPALHLTALAH